MGMHRRMVLAGTIALGLATLTACGTTAGSSTQTHSSATAGTTISVVASTNVWGDVTSQIAGDLANRTVQITSIISDPNADPHSYEVSTQNQLALSKAQIVIENGGGYDDFVTKMLDSAKNSSATVLNAVDISGKKAQAGEELNEHVWYDFGTVDKVAQQISDALGEKDPANKATYEANEKSFEQKVAGLTTTEQTIKSAHAGAPVAITEPVPVYMLEACGLVNKTPEEFSEAVEDGTDVAASVLKQTTDLFDAKQVKLLAYNEQTTGDSTTAVLDAAKRNDIPVVPVTETLPDGENYISWMQSNLDALSKALG
ncbi:zinc/manganese transport system substrate-binding protein [Propionibacterium cyclohexanicum]|uniref:Zinc/manganese transport system substrate-binding protein n=1 Tax=Propionibacterium cyclohexanicum TaxID=64702 RepID=A0A1H9TJJ0_9ACTN|nr:zinc ABC transporter substrate-binding protein [Propionibacterium cyclohexanicum]SER97500.1 zinc/manganese transport system substrate-binding protein [Propionibacterium cyclohexanicum]